MENDSSSSKSNKITYSRRYIDHQRNLYIYNYTSAELGIMYDLTIKNIINAKTEYKKILTHTTYDTIDKEEFWLFHPMAIKFLKTTL